MHTIIAAPNDAPPRVQDWRGEDGCPEEPLVWVCILAIEQLAAVLHAIPPQPPVDGCGADDAIGARARRRVPTQLPIARVRPAQHAV